MTNSWSIESEVTGHPERRVHASGTQPMTQPITTVDHDLDIDLESLLGDQDPDDCAHIVRRSGSLGAGALVTAAAESGMEVVALCGHRWVPKGFAPDDLPACRRCVEIWQNLAGGA